MLALEQLLTVTEAWRAAHPGTSVGVLALRGVTNPPQHGALDERKAALEQSLRERYGGLDRAALAGLPVLQAYGAYYKRFKKTYHIALQLESFVFKGRSLPNVAALVEAMREAWPSWTTCCSPPATTWPRCACR